MLKSYVKKPVVIQAVKFEYSKECLDFLKEWMQDSSGECSKNRHLVAKGDYIIKGVKGEFYPCKPDIFELTYQVLVGE